MQHSALKKANTAHRDVYGPNLVKIRTILQCTKKRIMPRMVKLFSENTVLPISWREIVLLRFLPPQDNGGVTPPSEEGFLHSVAFWALILEQDV